MSGSSWSDDEIASLSLPYTEFRVRYPHRSQSAFQHKRLDHARSLSNDDSSVSFVSSRSSAPKAASVVHTPQPELSDEDLFAAVVSFQHTLDQASTHPLEYDITMETDQPIAIAFPSDWHIGSAGTDLQRIKDDVELIANHPRLFAAVGGDPVDNFVLEGMGNAARSQVIHPANQYRLYRHLVERLHNAHSLLYVSAGNHDAWTEQLAGIDGVLASLRGVPVVYTGEGALVRLTVGTQLYRLYRKHKPTRWRSSANVSHFLKMMLMQGAPWEFDLGISEHVHQEEILQFDYRRLTRVAISCGSYKVSDPYAEGLGFYGGGYGVPTVVLRPDRREMLPFWSIQQAIDALDGVRPAARAA